MGEPVDGRLLVIPDGARRTPTPGVSRPSPQPLCSRFQPPDRREPGFSTVSTAAMTPTYLYMDRSSVNFDPGPDLGTTPTSGVPHEHRNHTEPPAPGPRMAGCLSRSRAQRCPVAL